MRARARFSVHRATQRLRRNSPPPCGEGKVDATSSAVPDVARRVLDKTANDCKTSLSIKTAFTKIENGGNHEHRSSPAGVAGACHWTIGSRPRLCRRRMKMRLRRTSRRSARLSSPPTPRHWTGSARRNSVTATPTRRIEDKATFIANATDGKSKWLSLAYQDVSIRVVGPAAIVRFHWVGESETAPMARKAPPISTS